MDIQTFFSSVHRRARTGASATDFSNTAANRDILNALNAIMFKMWRKHPWDYSVEGFTLSVASGTSTDITIPSSNNAGQLLAMTIQGKEGVLDPISLRRYYTYKKTVPAVNGTPTNFVRRGLDSNKNLRFMLAPAPDTAIVLNIDAKKKITPYVFADIAANLEIQFFPDYTHDIILEGVLEIIHQTLDHKEDALISATKFNQALLDLIADDEVNKPDEDLVEQLDDDLVRRNRLRGQDTGVY